MNSLDFFDPFIAEHVTGRGLELYAAQEEAILELFSGKNVILNTPTGSGKSLVAAALHYESLRQGRRSFYTSPIKALVNEKFLALCRDFGPENVGMITGDASVNPSAPIICCTAEILAIDALRYGAHAPVQDVVMDEFHYYSDRDRGWAWQTPLLALTKARFLLMSATLGDTDFFEQEMTKLTGRESVTVRSSERPVPLEFDYVEMPIHETLAKLVEKDRAPVYVVHFTQRDASEGAQNLLSTDFCTKDHKRTIAETLEADGVRFSSPFGKDMQRLLKHGIGLHHAGLLPKYRLIVEKLAQKGLLKIICGTDTLGVGVNIPIRTVLFTQLCKFDGEKSAILTVRDFKQISGRAGRKGFDTLGTVVAQAPEHVIENKRMEEKGKKFVKRKPPEKGYIPWDRQTFQRLIDGKPEALVSRFQVTHAMLLNVLSRANEDGCRAMHGIIRRAHETPTRRRHFGAHAFQLFRSLIDRNLIELKPALRVNLDLQTDFSLNQTLSLYLIDTLKLLDPLDPEYALDALTLVESILENPDVILRKQLDALKTLRVAEMKAEGLDYDARMAELEKMEYPKPNRDFVYDTFNDFAAAHPWVGTENIRPKSIAREMYENFVSFPEYVRDYGLQRSEGLVLRYLSEAYKTLVQNVPAWNKNDEIHSMADYFGTLVRGVDSSLLDEWERLRNPEFKPAQDGGPEKPEEPKDILSDRRGFTVLVRNEVFRLVRALASGDYELAAAPAGAAPTVSELEAKMKEYYASGHSRLLTDPEARSPKRTQLTPDDGAMLWRVEQTLHDPDGHDDWIVELSVDLEGSRLAGKPIVRLNGIRAL